MLVQQVLPLLAAHWPLILVSVLIVNFLRNKFQNGLHRYPGPALAAYTNVWRFGSALRRRTEHTYIELHRQHGDVVRVGPNALSFADPRAVKAIYGLNSGLVKSEFYPVQQAVARGRRLQSLFSTTDEAYHARYRRCVNGAFAMSALVGYEPLVDRTTDAFVAQTRRRYCEDGTVCDFARWLQFFAFDVIGELTWSKRLGFVDRDEDVDGIVAFVAAFLSYAGPIGQMPWLDLVWSKNPVRLWLQRIGLDRHVFPVTQFALSQAAARSTEMDKIRAHGLSSSDEDTASTAVDLLSKFTQAQHDHPEFMTDAQVLSSCTSMIFAGSETTAISLSSVFYHVTRHPRVYQKLLAELDDAVASGTIAPRANNKVSWAEAQQLPYLDAVIQESFRMHPAAGLPLERVVPPGPGLDVCGHLIPPGTIVGVNAWVLHRRPEIFGDDVDVFRPERWLSDPRTPDDEARRKLMRGTLFQFGAGARTCIGKNISLLEIYKLVPTFLLNFDVRRVDAKGQVEGGVDVGGDWERGVEDGPVGEAWQTKNAWFVRPLDFRTVFAPRGRNAGKGT